MNELPTQPILKCVSVEELTLGPWNSRENLGDDFDDFAESIRSRGVLQPVAVREIESGGYEVIAGKRRVSAAKQVGLEAVPVIVHDLDDEGAIEVALLENLQRVPFEPMEEAHGYYWLLERGRTQEQIAAKLKVPQNTVSERLALLELSADEQAAVKQRELGVKKAVKRVEARRWLKKSRQLLADPDSQVEAVLSMEESEQLFDFLSGDLSAESGLLDLDQRPLPEELSPAKAKDKKDKRTWRELLAGSEGGLAVKFTRLLTPDYKKMEVADRILVKDWVRSNVRGYLRKTDPSHVNAQKTMTAEAQLEFDAANALALDAFSQMELRTQQHISAFANFLVLALDRRALEFFARRCGVEKVSRLAEHELRARVMEGVAEFRFEQLALQVLLVIVSQRDGVPVVEHQAAQPWIDLFEVCPEQILKAGKDYASKRLEVMA